MIAPACLEAQIGPGIGLPHDIALVQAMLAHIGDIDERPYWSGAVDGRGSDSLDEAVERFQEDFDLLDGTGGDIRTVVAPESVTFHCMREAVAPILEGLRAVPGTATLYLPSRGGARVLRLLTAKLRSSGFAGNAALGRCLAVVAERVFDRHRFLVRFPDPREEETAAGALGRICVRPFGLKWITSEGRLASSELPHSPAPAPLMALVSAEIHNVGLLAPEPPGPPGGGRGCDLCLWLRYES